MKTDETLKGKQLEILRITKLFGHEKGPVQITTRFEHNFTTDKYLVKTVMLTNDNTFTREGSLHDVIEYVLSIKFENKATETFVRIATGKMIRYFYNEFQPACVEKGGKIEHFEILVKPGNDGDSFSSKNSITSIADFCRKNQDSKSWVIEMFYSFLTSKYYIQLSKGDLSCKGDIETILKNIRNDDSKSHFESRYNWSKENAPLLIYDDIKKILESVEKTND